jgi:insertion element IS1 protein InsB
VWGRRNLSTAKNLHKRLKELKISFDTVAMDDWQSFKKAFADKICLIGKAFTKGIEGNNTRLRHRIRRAFRRTCNFSKKLENHIYAFELAFFYINFGYV